MVKFVFRVCINLFKLIFVIFPLEVIGWVILLPVCYFSKSEKLPYLLRYYDNADMYIGRDTSVYSLVLTDWIKRYYWLAFRNPLNYFGYKVLGFSVTQELIDYKSNLNWNVGDSQGKHEGLLITEFNKGYEYYFIKKWNDSKCCRFRMGWKIGIPNSNSVGSIIQWVFVLQPYKSYTGA